MPEMSPSNDVSPYENQRHPFIHISVTKLENTLNGRPATEFHKSISVSANRICFKHEMAKIVFIVNLFLDRVCATLLVKCTRKCGDISF